jgi:O-antigen ligase
MLFWLLSYFYLLLPFSFALNPTASIDLPMVRIVIIGIFFVFLGKALLKKNLFIHFSLSSLFLLSWFLWAALSTLWSLNPDWSYRKIFFLFNFLLLFLVLLGQQEKTLKDISRWYVFGAVSIAIGALFQSFSQLFIDPGTMLRFWTENILPFFLGSNFSSAVATYPSLLVNIMGETYLRATGFFPDPHIFSYYVAMAIPLSIAYWKKSVLLSRTHLATAILFASFLLSFSRGGYVALTFSLLWFLILSFFWHKRQKRALLTIVVGLFLVVVVISPVGARFISSFTAGDGSRSERLELAWQAIEAIKAQPLLGVGLGNYPLWVKPEADPREPIYAHNIYLDIAVELGLVGLGLFLIALAGALFVSLRKWLLYKDSYYLAIHIALVYFVGHGFFEAPLFSVHILPVFLLFVAACFVNSEHHE